MAAATHDLKELVGETLSQHARAFTWRKRIDFSAHNSGAGESNEFIMIPAHSLVTRVDAILRTAEGGTLTIDIGDEANEDGWNDGGNANGTPDALIATGTAAAYAAGKLYHAAAGLRITTVNAADAAVVDVIVHGYSVDDR